MEATDFLRTTVAAVAISVAFLGSNETANARPYHHKFSCYDFAWQSQDMKDCLARGARPAAAAAPEPHLAALPYRHQFSCYDFAWQSRDLSNCLAELTQAPTQAIAAAKPAPAPLATVAKVAAKPLPR